MQGAFSKSKGTKGLFLYYQNMLGIKGLYIRVKWHPFDSEYELFVVYSDGDEELLATFYKDNTVSEHYFQVRYNDNCFYDAPGTPLHGMAIHESGYYLRTRIEGEDLGRLYFRNINRPLSKDTEDFRIRVRTDQGRIIRPGDDMQLRFGVSGSPAYDTAVSEGDFVVVYDKKLLWRAQLYIDETLNADGTPSGVADWNNENRWTYAQGNEWDRDWFDHDNDGITREAGPYNGGQCTIQPWTRPFYDGAGLRFTYAEQTEYTSVAYTEVGRDTPMDFNKDMNDQKLTIRHYNNLPDYNTTLASTNNE